MFAMASGRAPLSAPEAAGALKSAVGVNSRCSDASEAIVRAPGAVGTVATVSKWPSVVSATTLIVPSRPLALYALPSNQATPSGPRPIGAWPITRPAIGSLTTIKPLPHTERSRPRGSIASPLGPSQGDRLKVALDLQRGRIEHRQLVLVLDIEVNPPAAVDDGVLGLAGRRDRRCDHLQRLCIDDGDVRRAPVDGEDPVRRGFVDDRVRVLAGFDSL